MLLSGTEMNVQILGGVIVVHINRHFKINAVNRVHQFDKTVQIHRNIKIHRKAHNFFHLLLHGIDARPRL